MPDVDYHLKILRLSGTPTKAQIAKAYRREISQWHPDKHQHDARRQQAEEAAKQINAAYAFLKTHKFSKAKPPSGKPAPAPEAQFVDKIVPVNSPRINSVRYDVLTRSFSILYRDGHVSRFTKVPQALFDRFLAASSKEIFLSRQILDKFPEEKIA